jgi:hypothetical protein
MIHGRARRALFFMVWLTMMSVPAWPQEDLDKLKSEYKAVSSQLQKHFVFDSWIDSDPESPKLLARQWSLAGEWVAAWLDAHPSEGPDGLKTALGELVPDGDEPEESCPTMCTASPVSTSTERMRRVQVVPSEHRLAFGFGTG